MSALLAASYGLGYLTGEISPTYAAEKLTAAVEEGELNAQQRPAGHPIFAALAQARGMLTKVQNEAAYSAVNITPGTQLYQDTDAALDALYDAMALPDSGAPAKTVYQQIQALPWTWIAAGLGLLGVGFYLFRGKR